LNQSINKHPFSIGTNPAQKTRSFIFLHRDKSFVEKGGGKYYSVYSPGSICPLVNFASANTNSAEFQPHKVRLRGVIYADAGNAFNFIAFGARVCAKTLAPSCKLRAQYGFTGGRPPPRCNLYIYSFRRRQELLAVSVCVSLFYFAAAAAN
jgi:hypothetical protein